MRARYQQRVLAVLAAVWVQLFLLVLMFMLARYAMFKSFVDPAELDGLAGDVRRMWVMGLRFDARASALLLFVPLCLGVLSAC